MIFKVSHNKKIHMINSDDKKTLEQLKKHIHTLFKGLEFNFNMSYIDADGDQISLIDESDYKILLSSNLKTTKIFVQDVNEDFIEATARLTLEDKYFDKE